MISSKLKNEILEHWRVYRVDIPIIASTFGISEREVEHIIFPNGKGGKVWTTVVKREKPKLVEVEVDPKELLDKISTLKPEIDKNPVPLNTKREKDPKMIAAGYKAHETRRRNLEIKKQLELQILLKSNKNTEYRNAEEEKINEQKVKQIEQTREIKEIKETREIEKAKEKKLKVKFIDPEDLRKKAKKIAEDLVTIPKEKNDKALELLSESLEYISVGLQNIQDALKLLKNE